MAHCTNCFHEGAYVGYTTVECPNIKCRHFSEVQFREWSSNNSNTPVARTAAPEQLTFPFAQSTRDEHDSDDDGIAYTWVTHHHDFGDC